MFIQLPKKPTFFLACSLVFSTAAFAGGLERETSAPSSYEPAASSPVAAETQSVIVTPSNYSRGVWISRSSLRPTK